MNIEINKVYYFNNRPVVVLREENAEFVFVAADLKLDHNLTGSNFCIPCNTDGYYHTCEQAGEVIDAIMEGIEDSDCFWVAKRYLREHPFEYKECVKLKGEIDTLKEQKESIKSDISNAAQEKENSEKELRELKLELHQAATALEANSDLITQQLEELEQLRNNYKPEVLVKNTNIKISSGRLLELLKAEIELNYLEIGGVDNWDWYGECFPDDYDGDAEAFDLFKNM